ncbi:MAG: hypothetical protein HWE11_14255 [Gammaproteobacteria bacterium]|nr:hypothetical protein [Gammaproteobacteria bacterium]
MKSVFLTIFFVFGAGTLYAQEPIEEGEVIMINPTHPSGKCENIFKEIAAPSFPTSLSAQHTVIKQGSCSVTLAFTVSKQGQLESHEIDTVEERCKPFIRSAIVALKKSSFNKQEITKHCYHTYTYELE